MLSLEHRHLTSTNLYYLVCSFMQWKSLHALSISLPFLIALITTGVLLFRLRSHICICCIINLQTLQWFNILFYNCNKKKTAVFNLIDNRTLSVSFKRRLLKTQVHYAIKHPFAKWTYTHIIFAGIGTSLKSLWYSGNI